MERTPNSCKVQMKSRFDMSQEYLSSYERSSLVEEELYSMS
jgi:hypothetical protein